MSFLRTAETVLGFTLNHFTLKNLLKHDRNLYRQIFELKSTHSRCHQIRPNQWPKISAFVPLLYAKSLGISDQSPTLNWSLEHGLLPKQLLLAKSVQLLLEACALHVLENENPVVSENLSKTLYEMAFNNLQRLNEPEVFMAMCKCVCDYQHAVQDWSSLENRFFPIQRWPSVDDPIQQHSQVEKDKFDSLEMSHASDRLTFENYAHFERCLDFSEPKNLPVLLSQWERQVQAKYAAVVAHACEAMALLSGHQTPQEMKAAYKFGQSFVFAFAANSELFSFVNQETEEERNRLRLPLILFLLQQANQNNSNWLQQMRETHLCSLQTHRLNSQIKQSIHLTRKYIHTFYQDVRLCLNGLKEESDSLHALRNLVQQLDQTDQIDQIS